jgi:DegV family protein with EDD domain
MKPFLDQGKELVCFAISEDMSTSANVMRLAADELEAEDSVHVIDSMNLSTGIGLLVIEAAIMASEGKNGEEITHQIEALRPYVRASFVVDTLTYLYRGGRCSGLSAMFGSALKLHPMIGVSEGKMSAGKKYRGSLKKVVMSYVKDLEPGLRMARPARVFITHSGCDRAIVEAARQYLETLGIFEEILETRAGGVVSSHCGPGTLGVLFIARE